MLALAFSQISRMVTLRKPCLANTSPAASTRRCRVSKVSSLAAICVSNEVLKHNFQLQHLNNNLRCQPVLFAPGIDPTLVSDASEAATGAFHRDLAEAHRRRGSLRRAGPDASISNLA